MDGVGVGVGILGILGVEVGSFTLRLRNPGTLAVALPLRSTSKSCTRKFNVIFSQSSWLEWLNYTLMPFLMVSRSSFNAESFIVMTTGRAPSLLGVATTEVRFLGIGVSVWVGGSVVALKLPQALLPVALFSASPRPDFFRLSFFFFFFFFLTSYGGKRVHIKGIPAQSFHNVGSF